MINPVGRGTSPRYGQWWLIATLIVFAVMHIPHLSDPPNGYHNWKESLTASTALNYYQEEMSFLLPRVHAREATDGVTGMQLPIYSYLVAAAYHLAGPSHTVAHLLTLLVAGATLVFFYRAWTLAIGPKAAGPATWAMAFSPLFFYYSQKIMPETLLTCLLCVSVWLWLLHIRKGGPATFLASALILGLASAVKPFAIGVCLAYLLRLIRVRGKSVHIYLKMAGYCLIALSLPVGWWLYAQWLQSRSDLGIFSLGVNLGGFNIFLWGEQFFRKLVLQWPAELWIGWALLPAFIIGVYRLIAGRTGLFIAGWIAGVFVFFGIFALGTWHHDYYTMTIVPAFAAVTGLGLQRLVAGKSWRPALAIVLVLAAPVSALQRVNHRFDDSETFRNVRDSAPSTIRPDELVIVQDESRGAIRLYQLNRFGWAIASRGELDRIYEAVSQGARYLLLEEPLTNTDTALLWLFEPKPDSLGDLLCYRVRQVP